MKMIRIEDASRAQTPHDVDVRPLFDSEHVQAVAIILQPDEALKLHVTPVDALFYVDQGEAVVEIGEERETVCAGTLVHSPAGVPHRLLNESEDVCRFLVLKTPRQTQSSRIL